jgi:outer membrane receptor for ferrienterochelin and colicin
LIKKYNDFINNCLFSIKLEVEKEAFFMRLILTFSFILFSLLLFSQENDSSNIFNYSIEDLMNTKVKVGAQDEYNIDESPGIIEVITKKEIEASGAKDLLELLQQVPGFHFGTEWDNIIGLGMRGTNATEGKFLILINGHQMNETSYGIFPFGNHISLNNIEKIEIIRGPGSTKYGGGAELAVLNIITIPENEKTNFTLTTGASENKLSRFNISSSLFRKVNEDLQLSFNGYYGNASQSNRVFNSLDNNIINYADSSLNTSSQLNFNAKYKNLSIDILHDNYMVSNIEAQGMVQFKGLFASCSYLMEINDKIHLSPSFHYKKQNPWYFVQFEEKEFYNATNNRYLIDIPAAIKLTEKTKISLGLEGYMDHASKDIDTVKFTSNNQSTISYNNISGYAEIHQKTKFLNILLGSRVDYHSVFGSAFSPRIALTKRINKINIKLLYSRAYKAPTISNIDYNQSIKPEKTNVFEFETRLHINKNFYWSSNVFYIMIYDPILYIPNPETGADYYTNFTQTGTAGAEADFRFIDNWGSLRINYSFYRKINNEILSYNVDGIPLTYGGFPQHKASFISSFNITNHLRLNYSANFYGKRYTYVHSQPDWSDVAILEYKESFYANLMLTYSNLFDKGFDLSAGIYDITNNQYEFINAYQGWQNQIPDMGREFVFKLVYNINNQEDAVE